MRRSSCVFLPVMRLARAQADDRPRTTDTHHWKRTHHERRMTAVRPVRPPTSGGLDASLATEYSLLATCRCSYFVPSTCTPYPVPCTLYPVLSTVPSST